MAGTTRVARKNSTFSSPVFQERVPVCVELVGAESRYSLLRHPRLGERFACVSGSSDADDPSEAAPIVPPLGWRGMHSTFP